MASILADVDRLVVPGLTHWNHPSFHAYFSISASGPAILADLLAAAFNVNAMLWKAGPVATELETVTLSWLRQLTGLPPSFEGIIYDTASTAVPHALVCARERLGLGVRERGLAGRAELPRLRVYCSEQAHSSIEKAAILVGFGQEGLRKLPVDDAFRMRADLLAAAIEEDRRHGWRPCCVVATVGTTGTASIDPVPAIAEVTERHGLWLHVDASYAGPAAIVPEHRGVLAGCDRADSLVMNPHKWLFVPIDLSVFYTRHMDVLRRAFSLIPEYLKTDEDAGARNYMDYGIQLGRRFRALKLWFVIRYFGAQGIVERLRDHIRLARLLAERIEADPDFEMAAPLSLSLVCFRYRPRSLAAKLSRSAGPERLLVEREIDGRNQQLLETVNGSGKLFLSHTRLNDRMVLRFAIGNIRTGEAHVLRAWDTIRHAAAGAMAHVGGNDV